MNGLNSIVIDGRLAGDPRSNVASNGASFCVFTIGYETYDRYNTVRTDYFEVVTWDKLAERCDLLRDKMKVHIVGKLSHIDGNDTRQSVVIKVHSVEFNAKEKEL
jgi:single-stranded DNA-binding protein